MTNSRPSGLSVSTIAIRRHIGTLMLAIAIIVVGFFSTTQLPVDLLPSITYPRIGLRADAPGISPEIAVDEITRPLEQALSATEGVVQVYSQTREGRISLDLYFEPGGNIDQALNDATAALNRSLDRLPDGLEQPRLFKLDPSQLPVYEFALTSPALEGVDLRVFADEELARELTVIPGVASVDVSGGVQEEVQVNLDLNRMQALNVNVSEVLSLLESRNQDVAGGRLEGGSRETGIRTVGRFQDANEIRNLSVEVNGNGDGPVQRVYLRDFAEIIDGTERERVFVTLNGSPAVKVSIQKQPDANTIQVVDGVKQRLEELRQGGVIDEDVVLTATLDESIFIQNSIRNVLTAGLTGAGLAAIAVLLFLGSLRQTLIIVMAIPLATLTAIILMGAFGLSLNVFSLGGLALGVGIVVDNSIVMLENIAERVQRYRQRGDRPGGIPNNPASYNALAYSEEAEPEAASSPQAEVIREAEAGSRELESALVASTATNLAAVIPFLMIGGFISLLFNELVLTISFAVAASLIVALTLIPMISSRLLLIRWSSRIGQFWLLRQFSQRLVGVTRGYARTLGRVLQYRGVAIALAFVVLGGGSWMLLGQVPQEILPRINTGQARLFANFPPGTTLDANRRAMAAIDEVLMEQPETRFVFTTAGGALFGTSTSENALRGSSTITLAPGESVDRFVDRMNRELNQLNLVDTRLRLSPESVRGLILSNSPVRADVDIVLQGENTETLQQAGRQVLAALDDQATLASYRPNAEETQSEIRIVPDWERADALNLSTRDIGETIRTALQGAVPTQLQRGDRLVDIRVQLADDAIREIEQLNNLPLFTQNNQLIRLQDVARVELGTAPGEIQRINQRQVFIIAGSLQDGASLGAALAESEQILASVDLPAGVSVLPSSAAQTNQQLQQSLRVLGGLAAFLVFVVMAVQYNSLIDPLVIMLTVPLALAGGILGLFMTQTGIGATVIVGVVLLVGIVVNNAIIMVELANQIRQEEGLDHQAAILKAAPQRLRPILMTTVTTVLGLFPLALGLGEGSEFLQPLGIVVFSGLSLATVLTLFIIPCFYTLLHDPRWGKWVYALTHRHS
jgi:multidrug efflux pump subunit AcrB